MAASFVIALHDGFVDGLVEVFRSGEGLVGEVMPLHIAPSLLDVVEFGGVLWQPFDREPVCPLGECGYGCLAGVDGTVIEDKAHRLDAPAGLGAVAAVEGLQKRDEVGAALGAAGLNDQLASGPVEHAEQGHLGGLSRRRDAQIGSALGPDMGQIGMGERFGLIPEQEHDVAGLSLYLHQLAAQADPVHGIGVLTGFQGVARPAPAEITLWRSTTDRREREMRTPERFSISSAKRGSVQLGRSATGPDSTCSATTRAHSALTEAGPGALPSTVRHLSLKVTGRAGDSPFVLKKSFLGEPVGPSNFCLLTTLSKS